jgi:asparagine synthase (glutamine-hydrolysing)
MCGIAGFLESSRRRDVDECEEIVRRMALVLQHRGPDDEGIWADAEAGVALGHRRLAILDLTSEGHQPMHSADGNYVLTFNGEIYNFNSLRDELEPRGHAFRGHSDTEVMLAAFCEWGLLPALERFAGMFAFALWDRRERKLHLARDRAGEKPLYYGWTDGVFVFGSELKALRAHPHWRAEVSRRALALFLRHGYISSPHCIYENIHKLPPGCVLTLAESDIRTRRTPEPARYWSAQAVAEAGAARPFAGTEAEAGEQLRELLFQSVGRQMVADVPLGAFLSGGIDSSLVVALMQAQSRRPIKTFSIGFQQEQFNEAPFAKAVAEHLGTDHTELYIQPKEAREVIPKLPCLYDEPFADPSQIPTALLCELAGAHVKVSLSGDGGDELFGGYNRYREVEDLWKVISRIPKPFRKLAGRLNRASAAGLNCRMASGPVRPLLHRLWNLSDILSRPTDRSFYQLLLSSNHESHLWLKEAEDPDIRHDMLPAWERLPELLQRMMCHDLVFYLPDDILVKVDRAAMAVSLETRIPLLDHRVIEFAFRLPGSFKQKDGQGKWLLRQVLYQFVPPALVDRPKRGFGAPIAEWLRGPMREWAEELLGETRLHQDDFFKARQIRQIWREHLDQKRNWSAGLWHVLMFQAWLDEQKRRPDSDLECGDMLPLSSTRHVASGQSADTSAHSKSEHCLEPPQEAERCQVSLQK